MTKFTVQFTLLDSPLAIAAGLYSATHAQIVEAADNFASALSDLGLDVSIDTLLLDNYDADEVRAGLEATDDLLEDEEDEVFMFLIPSEALLEE